LNRVKLLGKPKAFAIRAAKQMKKARKELIFVCSTFTGSNFFYFIFSVRLLTGSNFLLLLDSARRATFLLFLLWLSHYLTSGAEREHRGSLKLFSSLSTAAVAYQKSTKPPPAIFSLWRSGSPRAAFSLRAPQPRAH
jgi:hypothetical protein